MAFRRRLIYADTAVEALSRLVLLSDHEKQILNLYIDQCMAVDAVEVVRCKDCRFWHEDTVSCDFVTADTNWYKEDFCSYGERKDNGQT